MKTDLNTVIMILGFLLLWWTNKRDMKGLRDELAALSVCIHHVDDKLKEIERAFTVS